VDLLDRLADDPVLAALFFDVDGVLAPIVSRPEDARVPEATRVELRRLNDRYALVACVSGRAGDDARRIVGVPGLTYVGNHGLELDPESDAWAERLRAFLGAVDWAELEDKRLSASLHYRNVEDEAAARANLEKIAERARAAGFVARFGRKVLEVLPPLEANKGTAVWKLLAEHELERALYAGDDTTDLDGFAALEPLELGIRVAVASAEGPEDLRAAADLVIDSPAELFELLRRL
jgi:trehalose 6-phosphate phosphatase